MFVRLPRPVAETNAWGQSVRHQVRVNIIHRRNTHVPSLGKIRRSNPIRVFRRRLYNIILIIHFSIDATAM